MTQNSNTWFLEDGKWIKKNGSQHNSIGDFFPSIRELDKKISPEFENREVIVLEKLRGKHARLIFDGNQIFCGDESGIIAEDNDLYGLRPVFKNKYYEPFKKLISALHRVPFTLFGELLGSFSCEGIKYLQNGKSRFVGYDLYINGNWVNWDDFCELTVAANFEIAPLLYSSYFHEDLIKRFACAQSVYAFNSGVTGQPTEGVVIKPTLEDDFNTYYYNSDRMITKITNPQFLIEENKKEKNHLSQKKNNKKLSAVAASNLIDELEKSNSPEQWWFFLLEEGGLNIEKNKKSEVLRYLVSKSIDLLDGDIVLESVKYEIPSGEVIKELKKQLPTAIMKSLYIQRLTKK